MTTTAAVLANLKGYTGKPNDDTYLKRAMIAALRELRYVRTSWSEGEYQFYTYSGKMDYGLTYPSFPKNFLSIDTIRCSLLPVENAVVTTWGSASVVGTPTSGYFEELANGGAEDNATRFWDPSTLAGWTPSADDTATAVVQIVFVDPSSSLTTGTGKQKFTVYAKAKNGVGATLTLEAREIFGNLVIASKSHAVSSTSILPYEVEWDASNLSENPPSATNLALDITTTPSSSNTTEIHSAVWTTGATSYTDSRPLDYISKDQYEDFVCSTGDSSGAPTKWSWHRDHIFLGPIPDGVYEIWGSYLKDSTVDQNGNEITDSFSGTETNDWFVRGQHALEMKALEIYYMTRAQNPNAAEWARLQHIESIKSIKGESYIKKFRGPLHDQVDPETDI